MFTGWDRPSHWLVLAVVVVVLFGYKKLPDAARSVGRSLRVFKTEIKGMSDDDAARAAAATSTDQAAAAPSTVDGTATDLPASEPPSVARPAVAADQPSEPPHNPAGPVKPASQPTTPGTV